MGGKENQFEVSQPFPVRPTESIYAPPVRRGVASSMDSDLEAFSHNPADGSFGPVPSQTGPNTNYLNERFLSY